VFQVIGKSDPIGDENSTAREEGDGDDKDGTEDEGEVVNEPEGRLDEGVEDIVRADLALAGDEVAVVEQAVEGDAEDLEAESDERPESTNCHGGRQEAKLTLRRFSRIDHFLK